LRRFDLSDVREGQSSSKCIQKRKLQALSIVCKDFGIIDGFDVSATNEITNYSIFNVLTLRSIHQTNKKPLQEADF
jgi:hypothetical protein